MPYDGCSSVCAKNNIYEYHSYIYFLFHNNLFYKNSTFNLFHTKMAQYSLYVHKGGLFLSYKKKPQKIKCVYSRAEAGNFRKVFL